MFSGRLDWSIRANPISELLAEKRGSGEEILDLTESNPTRAGIEYPAGEIARALADPRVLGYEPQPFGSLQAREAVAGYYRGAGFAIEPARILLTASTSESYAYLFKLLAGPGDEILTPRPSYPLFEYLAALEGVKAIQYPLFYDHGWHIDTAAFRSCITARTRAIVVVNPNNPTGSFLKTREFEDLQTAALEHDLAIISDEVFSDYEIVGGADRIKVAAANSGVLTFSLSGLSKVSGLPQMKLGWIAAGGPESVRDRALERLELIADTYLSVSAPVQLAAPVLLDARRPVQAQIHARIGENLNILRTALAPSTHIRLLAIEGGWSVILQVPRVRSEQEWVLALLREHGTLVQPGFFYDFDFEALLVISLLTPPATLQQGVCAIVSSPPDPRSEIS